MEMVVPVFLLLLILRTPWLLGGCS
jgi:hypothetical protein